MSELVKYFTNASKEVFRLELLPSYSIEAEEEDLQRFLAGERPDLDPEFIALCNQIREDRRNGKQHVRVRLVPKTVTDYIRFEIVVGYQPRAEAGEVILMIGTDEYETLLTTAWRPRDFYAFDNSIIVELLYDNDGHFVGERVIEDGDERAQYLALKKKLLTRGQALQQFMRAHPGIR